MPEPFFSDDEARRRLGAELDSWLGTPFKHHTGVKGLGADCIHLAVRVIEAVRPELAPLTVPPYPRDWHLHREASLLVDGLQEKLNVIEAPLDRPMDGDLILFKFGRTLAHTAIFYQDRFYHAVTGVGVAAVPAGDRMWLKRRKAAFRMMRD